MMQIGHIMTTVDLIYFNAGGGHRAAALALQAVIREQQRPWRVRLVNLFDVLDPEGLFRRIVGASPEDLYNKRLAGGWTIGMSQELMLLQGLIRLGNASMHRRLTQHWLRTEPDMVVSLVPNFNRVMYESLGRALPGVPYVTVMTDMADFPPNFWIEHAQKQHIVCGTPAALAQARAAGYAERQLHLASGMIIRPDFYRPLQIDRRAERVKLGLHPERPTGVVLFGGTASHVMSSIARQLRDVPLILMCGHNAALAAKLRAQTEAAHHVVVEFTQDVRRYMALADFFIGKPGPGCLSEAVQQGLPVITVRNAFTMPQERYNASWVEENGLGLVLRSWRAMATAVQALTADLRAYRYRVARVDNRAVFEVPAILADILRGSASFSSSLAQPTCPAVMALAE